MRNSDTNLGVSSSASEPNCTEPEKMEKDTVEARFRNDSSDLQCQSSDRFFKPQRTSFREPGDCSEETFFDSHLCLDSDCEDYFSVNGDNTPCVSETPSRRSTVLDEDLSTETTLKSPNRTSQNKLLIDLFHESFNSDNLDHENIRRSNAMPQPMASNICYLPRKTESKKGSSFSILNFVCNSKKTHKMRSKSERREEKQSASCCLPNLVRSLSIKDKDTKHRTV